MKKKTIILLIIAVVLFFSFIAFSTYTYFTGNQSITNVANINAITEQNNMVFDTLGGEIILDVTASSMSQGNSGSVAAEDNTTFFVNFTANTNYNMVCSYDIIYEWTSEQKYTSHTTGVTDNEFTIQATLLSNSHVSEGTNNILDETDLSTAVGNNQRTTVIQGARIDGIGNAMSTAVWTISAKFYNVNANQIDLSNKTYTAIFKVVNVSCVAGTV